MASRDMHNARLLILWQTVVVDIGNLWQYGCDVFRSSWLVDTPYLVRESNGSAH